MIAAAHEHLSDTTCLPSLEEVKSWIGVKTGGAGTVIHIEFCGKWSGMWALALGCNKPLQYCARRQEQFFLGPVTMVITQLLHQFCLKLQCQLVCYMHML